MGLGNYDDLDYYFLNLKGMRKTDNRSYIEATHADTKEITEHPYVEGKVFNIETRIEEWEGKKFPVVIIKMKYEKQGYYMKMRMSQASRTIISKLLTLDNYTNIKIGIRKAKEGEYKNVYVHSFDEKTNYFITLDEQNSMINIIEKGDGTKERDYSKLDKFYLEKIEEILVPYFKNRDALSKEDVNTTTPSEEPSDGDHDEQRLDPDKNKEVPF